jgi:hypothetical protein
MLETLAADMVLSIQEAVDKYLDETPNFSPEPI